VALGLILVPPVLLKIASTTWRMAAYYRGDAAYREKGPPALTLRIVGPLLVFLTLLVFGSGLGLVIGPHSLHSSFLIMHTVDRGDSRPARFNPPEMRIHSANPPGHERLLRGIDAINRRSSSRDLNE